MRKGWLFLLLCLTIAQVTYAHEVSIKGVVYSKITNTPLEGAIVSITQLEKTSVTDRFGKYAFHNLKAGEYEVKVSYLGFLQEVQTVSVTSGIPAVLTTHLETSNLELQEVSVVAKRENPLQLISAVDAQLRPIHNAQEMLRMVPGLIIAQHAGGGKAEQIFLRGFDIDHGTDISLTADGMPVNMVSHAHGQGYSDLHFLIPETIEAVDFGKGPYHADKGNFATAGYADFRTRSVLDQSMLKFEAGQFDTYRAVGMVNLLGQNARNNQQNAYIASEYLFSNGYFESPQGLNRFNVLGRYQGIFNKNTILTASLSAFKSNWDASGQIPERAVMDGSIGRFGAIDDTEGGYTSRYNANITLDKTLGNGALLKNQAYAVKYGFELYSNFTFFLNDPENGDQIRQKENREIYGYQSSYEQDLTFLGFPLRHKMGVGFRYDDIHDSELSRTKNRSTTLSQVQKGDIDELNAFTYVSETWELTPRFTVNAALRADRIFFTYRNALAEQDIPAVQKNAQNRFSPKLNLTYAVSPVVQVYLNSGMGYHSNDTRVSAGTSGREALPAARGTDLGLTFKPANRWFLNTALWFLDLDQELVYVGDEGVVEPSGKSRRYGVDVSVRGQITDYLYLDTDLNLARPRARDEERGNDYIPLAPTITSTGGLSFQNKKGFKGSMRYRFVGDRAANEDYSVTASGYFLLDAVASYTYKNLEFKLSGENLLNSNWKEAQFDTESRLAGEIDPVSEIHFTPGTPFFLKFGVAYTFGK
ncbi:TonB-dependent receptor [Rufibacter tibetensis]|uniref:TonB-dependent receptor n=1 Tax=Rufibacter tibetensis TaxID=512763 RepID=A0A0P0CSQ1_9BACT|nr:TonB-dependent receptor [Rufibacter tibetensis]ALJ00508.1 TonB-dependent receptor [Rufibacter tibetensis]